VAASDLAELTVVIKTFQRPKLLDRTVRSVRRRYPDLRILVADDSQQPLRRKDVSVVRLPTDVGIGAGRNALLARIRTPFFLLLDDDLELPWQAQIEPLLELVAGESLDIAAGDLLQCRKVLGLFTRRRPQPGHGMFELAGDQLTLREGHRSVADGFLWCDFVHNFFIANTEKVRALGGWDAELVLDEREEFFLRAHRQGLRVGLCPEVVAWHWNLQPKGYSTYRSRDFKPLAVAKMGLAQMTDTTGRRIVAAPQSQAA